MLEIVHGNRGLCAQPCRLPYDLYEESENKIIDKGYLLSPRDLNGTMYLSKLIKAGVSSFKIEGRLKNPEYVAEVTRYYRKYIDLAYENISLDDNQINSIIHSELNKNNKTTNITDTEEITQVFNRGGFSSGHLDNRENINLIFKNKPSNMGIFIGKIKNINFNKGHIFLNLKHDISIGDRISINDNTYTISELINNGKNIKEASSDMFVELGRMRGNLKINDSVYKIQNKKLSEELSKSYCLDKEIKKIPLTATINILENKFISIEISGNKNTIYENITLSLNSAEKPQKAINHPITKERIKEQFSKTGNTEFQFSNIIINLDDNLFIPKISILNDLRRKALSELENMAIQKFTRTLKKENISIPKYSSNTSSPKISILLNKININNNYLNIKNIDKLYIPLHFFIQKEYDKIIKQLCNNYDTYIYMPIILRDNKNFNLLNIQNNFKIKGAVISNISQIKYFDCLELIGNYTLNTFNKFTIEEIKELGIKTFTISPELTKSEVISLLQTTTIPSELIVYGKLPLMTNNYCYLGKSNMCYKDCKKLCDNNKNYYLKDRLGYTFRILPNKIYNLSTIYNSKITSINYDEIPVNNIRIDILDENINDINNIISTVKDKKRFEGNIYTNGKLK